MSGSSNNNNNSSSNSGRYRAIDLTEFEGMPPSIATEVKESDVEIRDTIKTHTDILKQQLLKLWVENYKVIISGKKLDPKQQKEYQLYIQFKILEIQNNQLILKITNPEEKKNAK